MNISHNIKKINNILLNDTQYFSNIIGSQNVIFGIENSISLDKYNIIRISHDSLNFNVDKLLALKKQLTIENRKKLL